MDTTDRYLIDAHLNGDASAFTEIVRRHADGLMGFLMKMCGNRHQAEDFFQETFQKVHQKAATFNGQELKPWLFSIAANIVRSNFRKSRLLPVLSIGCSGGCTDGHCPDITEITANSSQAEPSQAMIISEQTRQVRKALDLLPEKQRATLILVYYQQMSYSEVAGVLGCSVGTVKSQMFRALKKLARKLPDPASGVCQ